jgi:hypothetical protein
LLTAIYAGLGGFQSYRPLGNNPFDVRKTRT